MNIEEKQIRELIGDNTLFKFDSLIDGIITYKTVKPLPDDYKGLIDYEIQFFITDELTVLLDIDDLDSTYGSDLSDLRVFEVYEIYAENLSQINRNKIYNKFGDYETK